MKLYKNLVNSLASTLQEIFGKDRYADKALEKLFKKNPQWGSRDRRFVAEGVYDVVRNYRLYAELAESEKNFWFITAVWLILKEIEIPDWQEFQHLDRERILSRVATLSKNPAVAFSFPEWLWKLGESELGPARWLKDVELMHGQAGVYLRANTLKTTVEDLRKQLAQDEIECEVVGNSALHLLKRSNVFQHRLFKEGWFEVQDPGSQMIGEFLDPKPGYLVVDACAGAGGKSLHISALMKNKGRVVSMDVEEHKLEELKKRARRAAAFNIETRLIEGSKTIKSLESAADKLLLDVPCSGLGVLKRNPDAKWKLTPEIIERTRELQGRLLAEYSTMVKTGGELVYSTCSILPSENEEQVRKFLESNQKFRQLEERNLPPGPANDGFYMARLKRLG